VGEVGGAAAAVRLVAARLDPDLLMANECARALQDAAAIESMGATMKMLLAARLAQTDAYKATSSVSPEAHIAGLVGGTAASVRSLIETARQLGELTATASAARTGSISTAQVQAIASAATADPTAEHELINDAARLSLGQLRDKCAKVIADADPDPEWRHARLRRQRRGRRYSTPDGFHHLHLQSTPEDLADVDVTLNAIVDELFKAARAKGEREPRDAYLADAIVEMARRARGAHAGRGKASPTYTAVIRADLTALVRGRVGEGEVCEIAGLGPVPVEVIRQLLGDAVLKLVLTAGSGVRNVTSLGRGPTAAMKVALLWEQPTCSVERCGRRARLEADHTSGAEYVKTRHTRLDELDRLCDQHHDKKTYDGWGLVPGSGVRPMVPPTDPRHPSRCRAP
jgi:hypothetical protein